ncbi:MAG: PQQ-binding-like beta-propeller repeat protein [Alphaproteobacteria bacterium]|nr:PQQ-binding-like beta-propeller repeat protein [Alphaproteobacteria bacterium]
MAPRLYEMTRTAAIVLAAVTLSACGAEFFGESKGRPPLLGERISIMALERSLQPDERISELAVALPRPVANLDWPQPGGVESHVMQHPALGNTPRKVWSVDIGTGANSEMALLASPLVLDGRVFALDAEGLLTAFDAGSGERLWRLDTGSPDEEDVVYSGAITTGDGKIFAATGVGEVIAASVESGQEIWRVNAQGPIRGAPSYSNGRVFLTTIDNQALALSAESGERLWGHSGISENAALLGGASPAIKDNVVVIPYSSGEIFALKAETGRVFWADSLSEVRRANAVTSLADIRGNPVIDGDVVIAMSHSGRISALDFKSGTRIWDRRIGGTHTPWVAGEFVFIVSNAGEVIALTRRDGQVRWITQLPQFESPEGREGGIQYAGPVLAGDRLILASSLGELHAISPYSGELMGIVDIGDPVFISPIVAGETMYVLTDKGRLIAYR